MLEFIESILGDYVPVTYVDYYLDEMGTILPVEVIPSGVAGLDWSYIFTGLIFAILVFCFFKTLGGLICRIF